MKFRARTLLKLNFKLKIDLKMCTFKNLEETWKTWQKIKKNDWQPVF